MCLYLNYSLIHHIASHLQYNVSRVIRWQDNVHKYVCDIFCSKCRGKCATVTPLQIHKQKISRIDFIIISGQLVLALYAIKQYSPLIVTTCRTFLRTIKFFYSFVGGGVQLNRLSEITHPAFLFAEIFTYWYSIFF